MNVAWIVDYPLARTEAVKEKPWLLEREVVRIALWDVYVPFNPNDVGVVIPILRLERDGISTVPSRMLKKLASPLV